MTTRKPWGKNWSAEETEKLLDLRFKDEEILHKLNKAKEKKDEIDVWNLIAAKLSTNREGSQCKDRLKTLLASYKKLRGSQTSQTGNATLSLPPYWSKLCEYLTPYAGMRGECTLDSMSSGTSAGCAATNLMAAFDSQQNEEADDDEDKENTPSNEDEQLNLFSPSKKRKVVTKKGKELAEACDAMKTLATHIISKNDQSSDKVEQIASRVEAMEYKMNAILDILSRNNK